MVKINKTGILIGKTELGFENEGVLNPAVIMDNGFIHLFYRAVSKGNYSTIGYCKLKGPLEVIERHEEPLLFPKFDYESQGVEDPRIVKIDDLFYLSYTAYDGVNALGALAVSTDLIEFERKGILVPQMTYKMFNHLVGSRGPVNEKYLRYNSHEGIEEKMGKTVMIWDKNVIFFPRRINGKLCFLHRVKPDIQFASVNELEELTLEFWQHYLLHFEKGIVMSPLFPHEISYIGGGCPPIETELGWLLIYHSVYDSVKGYVYCACAALLDLENPQKVIARLPQALFQPELEWELLGEVNNVCFPTGAVQIEDTLYIYYGAADEQIAVASLNMPELLKVLMQNQVKYEK